MLSRRKREKLSFFLGDKSGHMGQGLVPPSGATAAVAVMARALVASRTDYP
jgi:hypothetical protein